MLAPTCCTKTIPVCFHLNQLYACVRYSVAFFSVDLRDFLACLGRHECFPNGVSDCMPRICLLNTPSCSARCCDFVESFDSAIAPIDMIRCSAAMGKAQQQQPNWRQRIKCEMSEQFSKWKSFSIVLLRFGDLLFARITTNKMGRRAKCARVEALRMRLLYYREKYYLQFAAIYLCSEQNARTHCQYTGNFEMIVTLNQ